MPFIAVFSNKNVKEIHSVFCLNGLQQILTKGHTIHLKHYLVPKTITIP